MDNKTLWALFKTYEDKDIYHYGDDLHAQSKALIQWRSIEEYTLPCQWAHRLSWWQVVQVMIRTGRYDDTLREVLMQKPEKKYPVWPTHAPIPYHGWNFIEKVCDIRPDLAGYIALNYVNYEWRKYAPAFMQDYFKLATAWMLYQKIGLPGSIFQLVERETAPMRHKLLEEYTDKQIRLHQTFMMDIGNGWFDNHKERIVPYMVQAVADDVITIMPAHIIPKISQSPH